MTISPEEARFIKALRSLDKTEILIFSVGCEALSKCECSTAHFDMYARDLIARHRAGAEITVDDLRGFRESEVAA